MGRSVNHEGATRAGAEDVGTTFPRRLRVRRRREFLCVQRTGRRVHTAHFIVVVSPQSEAGEPRIGITVTKKVAGSVGRNRVKRMVREVFRRHRSTFPWGCDVVVIAKSGAAELGYRDVMTELLSISGPLTSAARGARRASRADR